MIVAISYEDFIKICNVSEVLKICIEYPEAYLLFIKKKSF